MIFLELVQGDTGGPTRLYSLPIQSQALNAHTVSVTCPLGQVLCPPETLGGGLVSQERLDTRGQHPARVTWAASPCLSLPQSISIHEAPIKGLSGDLKGWQEVPGELSLPLS